MRTWTSAQGTPHRTTPHPTPPHPTTPHPTTPRRTPLLAVAAATAILALALSACSSSSGGNDLLPSSGEGADTNAGAEATPTEDDNLSMEDAMIEMARCMREHGIDMDDPVPGEPIRIGGPGIDRETLEAASEACRPIMEAARPPDRDGEVPRRLDDDFKEKLLAVSQCMRDKGYNDFPDPVFEEGGAVRLGVGPGAIGENVDMELMQSDMMECHQSVGLDVPGGGLPAGPPPGGQRGPDGQTSGGGDGGDQGFFIGREVGSVPDSNDK